MAKPIIETDVLILGAGVTGLTAASELLKSNVQATLIEDYAEPGGNHISKNFGPYSFDIGTIFFWTDSPLRTLFPGIDTHWAPIDYSVYRITPDNRVLSYPFDVKRELIAKPVPFIIKVFADILNYRLLARKKDTAADFARYYLGETLFSKSGLAYYLQRFYGFSMEKISYNFARRRMSWIAENASLKRRFSRVMTTISQKLGLRPTPPPLKGFARPRGGFSVMYRHALESLIAKGVKATLGAGIKSIERTDEGFVVTTKKGVFRALRLINTLPLAHASKFLSLDIAELPESSALVTLCYRFNGKRNFSALVLYNFHAEGLWKRLTMHSDYYGAVEGWEYFGVEVTVRGEIPPVATLMEDFQETTKAAGLFDGELELVGHFTTDFAYPVYDEHGAARKATVMKALNELGIESIGRQGDFDYIPSATEAVDLARAYMSRAQIYRFFKQQKRLPLRKAS